MHDESFKKAKERHALNAALAERGGPSHSAAESCGEQLWSTPPFWKNEHDPTRKNQLALFWVSQDLTPRSEVACSYVDGGGSLTQMDSSLASATRSAVLHWAFSSGSMDVPYKADESIEPRCEARNTPRSWTGT